MKKQRKSLSDSLAQEFVYGDESQQSKPETSPTPAQAITNQPEQKESSLMQRLQVPEKEATKRFTVDLPESLHRKLSIMSARTSRTKADIVRLLLEDALAEVDD